MIEFNDNSTQTEKDNNIDINIIVERDEREKELSFRTRFIAQIILTIISALISVSILLITGEPILAPNTISTFILGSITGLYMKTPRRYR